MEVTSSDPKRYVPSAPPVAHRRVSPVRNPTISHKTVRVNGILTTTIGT